MDIAGIYSFKETNLERFLEDLKSYQKWAEQDGLAWALH